MSFRDKGEEIASGYLRGKGYKILASNYSGRSFEIDLIAMKKNMVVFVEVKRRKSSYFMNPLDSINKKRKEHMIKGARYFLLTKDLYDRCDVRFDVITVMGGRGNVEHYEDAFRIEK